LKQLVTKTVCSSMIVLACSFTGCANRGDQTRSKNFSVRYNFLYNANELLSEYERESRVYPQEDFESIISVFVSHPPKPDAMGKVINKAKTIIKEKGNSSYMATAHLLMAKAYFNNEDFFTAIGYANDVLTEYSNEKEISDQALIIKARALLAIRDYEAAYPLILGISKNAGSTTGIQSEEYAVTAEAYIHEKEYEKALQQLKLAMQYVSGAEKKARMRYVCAQLLEKTGNQPEAAKTYESVEKSTASSELRLHAALNRIKLRSSTSSNNEEVPLALKKLIKQDEFQEYKNEVIFALANYEREKELYTSAISHYLNVAELSTENKPLSSKAYAAAADLQLRQSLQYKEAAENYQKAITALPRSTPRYLSNKNILKTSAEISNLYIDLMKSDSVQHDIEQPPFNEPVISTYYEIATLYFQSLQDSVEAEKVYQMINIRFPGNKLNKSVSYALNLLHSGKNTNSNEGLIAGNEFLKKRRQNLLENAVSEAADIIRNRNNSLLKLARLYDEPAADALITQNAVEAPPILMPPTQNTAPIVPVTTHPETAKITVTTQPFAGVPIATPQVKFSKENQNAIYYFVISVEDASLNLSPSRFGIGEFNRRRYADSNLKHKLLEFENTQVIYVGIFTGLEAAKTYAAEISAQLKSIMKTNGQKYSTAIISKENLEKLESDEIYKVYQDFSKQ
jgi:hypothetical protein